MVSVRCLFQVGCVEQKLHTSAISRHIIRSQSGRAYIIQQLLDVCHGIDRLLSLAKVVYVRSWLADTKLNDESFWYATVAR